MTSKMLQQCVHRVPLYKSFNTVTLNRWCDLILAEYDAFKTILKINEEANSPEKIEGEEEGMKKQESKIPYHKLNEKFFGHQLPKYNYELQAFNAFLLDEEYEDFHDVVSRVCQVYAKSVLLKENQKMPSGRLYFWANV